MISDDRLRFKLKNPDLCTTDKIEMAKELLALRKALSQPAAYEVKGVLCHTLDEAEIYVGDPEPLYRGPQ